LLGTLCRKGAIPRARASPGNPIQLPVKMGEAVVIDRKAEDPPVKSAQKECSTAQC